MAAHRRSWQEERAERLAQDLLIAATDKALKKLWQRFDDDELSTLARGLEVAPVMRSPEQAEVVSKLTSSLADWSNAL
jgi:hypothetical protein